MYGVDCFLREVFCKMNRQVFADALRILNDTVMSFMSSHYLSVFGS